MLAGVFVIARVRDEILVRRQQLGDDILVLFQHMLN